MKKAFAYHYDFPVFFSKGENYCVITLSTTIIFDTIDSCISSQLQFSTSVEQESDNVCLSLKNLQQGEIIALSPFALL